MNVDDFRLPQALATHQGGFFPSPQKTLETPDKMNQTAFSFNKFDIQQLRDPSMIHPVASKKMVTSSRRKAS